MIVAIIPARGGSKRIPRKNIRPFLGKPVIAYTIEAARACGVFDRIIVSTDDDEIAAVAERYGAEAPFRRSPELSDDYAQTSDVMAHAAAFIENCGQVPGAVCCLYPAAPFMQADDICAGLQMLQAQPWDFVFPATTFQYPIFRAFALQEKGGLRMFQPEYFHSRSQDLPEAWHDAGQFYWGTPEAWIEKRRIFGEKSAIIPLPRYRVLDIDTPEDWAQAEMLMKLPGLFSPAAALPQ